MMNKIVLLTILLLTCGTSAAETRFFPSPRASAPFSEAVQVGDLLFLSGRLGIDKGKIVEGGVAAETRAAMESIKSSVEKYGSSMDQVVKCTVFMRDMGKFSEMNEVYLSYFNNNKPARSAVAVSGLALNAQIEIECIASI